MKRVLSLVLGVLFLAGCSTTKPCPCSTAATPAPVAPAAVVASTPAVAAPVESAPVQEAPAEEVIPAAVRK